MTTDGVEFGEVKVMEVKVMGDIINECGAKSQFLTDKSESLMVLYKH